MTDRNPEKSEWPMWLLALGLVLAIVSVQGRGIAEPTLTVRVDGQVIGQTDRAIEYDVSAGEVRIYTIGGVMCRAEPRFWDRFEAASE